MHKYWVLWHIKRFSILDMAISSWKHQNFCIFLKNNVCLLKILLSNLIFFLFSKLLELFFTPKNTPPKVKNSKMGFNHIFFYTPCRSLTFFFWIKNLFMCSSVLIRSPKCSDEITTKFLKKNWLVLSRDLRIVQNVTN